MFDKNEYIVATIKTWLNGMLMVFAMRDATATNSKGGFVSLFVFLVALIMFMDVVRNAAAQMKANSVLAHKFDGFVSILGWGLSTITTYIIYVLTQDLKNWSTSIFLNGILELKQALTVLRIFIVLMTLGYMFKKYETIGDYDKKQVNKFLDDLEYKIRRKN